MAHISLYKSTLIKFKNMFTVGFEPLVAMTMHSMVFWDMTPFSPVKIHRRAALPSLSVY
jgi:hypothetical protein